MRPADPDGTALVLRLGVALDRYWRAASRLQEAFGLLVPVLRRPDARADPALFAAALVTAACAACWIDIATARHLAEQAVQVARQLGDDRLLIRSLAALCDAYFFAGEPETGLPFGQESVERARRLGDDVLLAESLLVYLLTIDPARSGQLFAEAIACTERSGDHLTNSVLHNNAGCLPWTPGTSPPPGLTWKPRRKPRSRSDARDTLVPVNLGLVLRAEGDLDGARSTFEAALRIGRRNGDSEGMAYAMPWPGVPGRRCGRLGPGSCAARRRAGAFRTGRAFRGRSSTRATAGTASTKRVRTWAMSSWSGPTPRAWRSASRRPSTWLSEDRVRPDRYRRLTPGRS